MSTNFQLNPVFDGLKPSSTLYINETVNKLWAAGEQVFHMGFGESRFNVNVELQRALGTYSDKKSYLPARGLPELTAAIANYYSNKLGQQFLSDQVIVGPGSKSLIYGLQLVLNADVFLPTPSWVSYAPQATLLGNSYSYIPSSSEDAYQFEISALDALVQASSNPNKLLVINSPNNPSGQMFSDEFLQELADYCRQNEVLVLSDEIYFQVVHSDVEHVSISKYYSEGTFVLGGLSKHFSIGGWRLGVALLPNTEFGRKLMSKMVVLASETWSGVAAPIQYAAILAYSLNEEVEQYVQDCRSIHAIRTKHCHRTLSEMGVACSRAEGAFYIAANLDRFREALLQLGVTTSAELATYLLAEHRIASLPGSDFGISETTLTLRLSTSYLDMESSADSQRLFDLYKNTIEPELFMSKEHHPVTYAALKEFKNFVRDLTVT